MRFDGIYPPVPTPFRDGRVDTTLFAENLGRWNATPVAGYLVLGAYGEAALLDDAEKRQVLRAARAVIPAEKRMIVGAGRESTASTIAAVAEAADLGADAVMVITPGFYRAQMTDEALEAHYRAVADGARVPLLLMNEPEFTGVALSPAAIGNLATHPSIGGMKETVADAGILSAIMAMTPPEFALLVGTGSAFLAGFCLGAAGACAAVSVVAPEHSVELLGLCRTGNLEKARALQESLRELNAAVTWRYGPGGLKAALDLLGFYGGPPRPPLLPVTEEQRGEIRRAMMSAGLLS